MVDDFRQFALYNIEGVGADLELLVKEQLVCDDVEEDTWEVQSFTSTRPEDIIDFHKGLKGVNQRFLLVADRQDKETEGLLVVNLDFQGVPDAVRMKARKALARRPFAVLVVPSPTSRSSVTQVVERIYEGVQSSHGETATVLAEGEGVDTDKMEEFVEYLIKWKLEKDWQDRLREVAEVSTAALQEGCKDAEVIRQLRYTARRTFKRFTRVDLENPCSSSCSHLLMFFAVMGFVKKAHFSRPTSRSSSKHSRSPSTASCTSTQTAPGPERPMVTRKVTEVVAIIQSVGLVIAKGGTRTRERYAAGLRLRLEVDSFGTLRMVGIQVGQQLIHELRHILQQVSEVLLAEQECDVARRCELVDHTDCFDESWDGVDVDGLAKALRGHVAERFDIVLRESLEVLSGSVKLYK
ncbi:hypothetical protein KC315_g7 [Hortaea werneckii]|nr:hypothetical protein KC315_g7 [Hortaea werneckii]